ncbi:VOC family protein [Polymorphobacter sp.]|uniref:VOC family protein n=1 Tax=Polymorphobacter sp. TaxID=1909290 RepID=UPI003F706626
MSRLFGPIFQTAYVVEALEPALEHWTSRLGVGPFFLFPIPFSFDWLKLDEAPATDTNVLGGVALAYSGDTMIEIIVPGTAPSTYRKFLDDGRSGVHHLGTVADDYEAQMAAARAAGIRVVMEGELPLSRFAYLETDTVYPGTMIEIIDMREGMHELFGAVKAASVGWDGRDPVRSL